MPKKVAAAAPAEKKVVEDKKVEEKGKQSQQQPQQQQGKGKGKQQQQQQQQKEDKIEQQPPQQEENKKDTKPERELDEVEKEITARIGQIDDEIRAHRAEIDKIQASIDVKKESNKVLQQEQAALKVQSAEMLERSKECSAKYTKKVDQIKEQQKLKKVKSEEQRRMREEMGLAADNTEYLKKLEVEIRKLQDRQQSGDVSSMQDERKLIAEISKLTNNKKLYKSCAELVAQYEKTISTLRDELAKIDEVHTPLREEKKTFEDKVTVKRSQHDETSKLIDQDYTKKKELVAKVNELEKKKDAEYDGMRAYRADRREKAQKKREEEQKKRAEERQAAEAKRQAAELKRQQEEDSKGFYASELDACTQLLSYLEPLKYTPPAPEPEESEEKAESEEGEKEKEKENEEGASSSTPAPAAEEKPKRGGKKKQPAGETDKEKELKHTTQTFFNYELLSLVAPVKVGDVEGSIAQITEKKVYLEKKQEERKERKANGN